MSSDPSINGTSSVPPSDDSNIMRNDTAVVVPPPPPPPQQQQQQQQQQQIPLIALPFVAAQVPAVAQPAVLTNDQFQHRYLQSNLNRRSSHNAGIKYKTKRQKENEMTAGGNSDGIIGDGDCAVCFCELNLPFETDCKHQFCFMCLKSLFKFDFVYGQGSVQQAHCPLCRTPISFEQFERFAKVSEGDFLADLDGEWVWKYSGRNGGWWLFEPQHYSVLECGYRDFIQWQLDERKKQLEQLVQQQQEQAAAAAATVPISPSSSSDHTTMSGQTNSTITGDISNVDPISTPNDQIIVQLAPPQQTQINTHQDVPTIVPAPVVDEGVAASDEGTASATTTSATLRTFSAIGRSASPPLAETTTNPKPVEPDTTANMATIASVNGVDPAVGSVITPVNNDDGNNNDHDDDDDDDEDDDDDDDDDDDNSHYDSDENYDSEDDEAYEQWVADMDKRRREAEEQRNAQFKQVRYCQLPIGSTTYIVDFIEMVQYPIDIPSRTRRVKREPKVEAGSSDTKGVSGVSFVNRNVNRQTQNSQTTQSSQVTTTTTDNNNHNNITNFTTTTTTPTPPPTTTTSCGMTDCDDNSTTATLGSQ